MDFSKSSFDTASVASPSTQAKTQAARDVQAKAQATEASAQVAQTKETQVADAVAKASQAAAQATQAAAQASQAAAQAADAAAKATQASAKAVQAAAQVAQLTAPQVTAQMLSPTPMALQPSLTAPHVTAQTLQATPLGPPATFQAPAAQQPGALPEPVTLNLAGSVGANGVNNPADVRQVQDRLHDLGFLSDAQYAAELADPTKTEAITTQSMPQTMEALRTFQSGVVGVTDGKISPGGVTARSLADPTYGTQTTFNPNASDVTAGVPVETFSLSRPVEQIVNAIEAVETGTGALGESPAFLKNASGTPASFGRGQLIGGTAVGVLAQFPDVAQHYGLDATEVQQLQTLSTNTATRYNEIRGQVPAGGVTEAELQRQIAEYTTAQGAQFHQDTGLANQDIENMFRAAQLRAQLPRGVDAATALENADIAANVQALGLSNSDLSKYINNPNFHGEHRAGFVTRALFTSENGQALRNAMTDNGGIPLSRGLIQDNYDQVTRRAQDELGRPLTAMEAAQATMLVHNSGMGALDGFFDGVRQGGWTNNRYVERGMQYWEPE
jgi:hypothetical protein